jgi:hypothetical protein
MSAIANWNRNKNNDKNSCVAQVIEKVRDSNPCQDTLALLLRHQYEHHHINGINEGIIIINWQNPHYILSLINWQNRHYILSLIDKIATIFYHLLIDKIATIFYPLLIDKIATIFYHLLIDKIATIFYHFHCFIKLDFKELEEVESLMWNSKKFQSWDPLTLEKKSHELVFFLAILTEKW